MARKTKIKKICRWSTIGLFAAILSFSVGGKALANCAPFPQIALWSELTHEFVRQNVDDKLDGDWGAYLAKLERYESKLKYIHEKGLGAGVTWRDKKVHLKGAKLADFLKLVEQRLTVTHCLADNDSLSEFSTAAGGTDGGYEVDSPKSKQCDPIPQVEWWAFKTHARVASYVSRKYGGDWGPYIDKWFKRLKNLKNIHERGSGAVTNTGITLREQELVAYINKMQKRNSVVRCLARKNSGPIVLSRSASNRH